MGSSRQSGIIIVVLHLASQTPPNVACQAAPTLDFLITIWAVYLILLCEERCRWDNSLLWDPPTESSFMGQIISSGLHHFRLFFLHTKLGKDISGTGNLDFQE